MNTYYIDFSNNHNKEYGMAFMLKKDYHDSDDNALTVFTNGNGYNSHLESQARDFSKARRDAMLDKGVTWFDLACAVWNECESDITESAQNWLKKHGYSPADEFLTMDSSKDIKYYADYFHYAYDNATLL